ncbi:MAG: hypothetical protein M0Z33_02085 [Actinomycetota bacterium]|nr:hypothetical protein [Actinomycetota bacterium]
MSRRGAARAVVGAVFSLALALAIFAAIELSSFHGWTAPVQFFAAVAAIALALLALAFWRLGNPKDD